MSLSEAVSNISSPDYQDQDDMFDTGRECPRMELSDPSDSDSTILVSEPCHKRAKSNSTYSDHGSDVTLNGDHSKDYRIVIQVKGPEKQNANSNDSVNNNNSNYAQNGKENGHNSPENQGYQVRQNFNEIVRNIIPLILFLDHCFEASTIDYKLTDPAIFFSVTSSSKKNYAIW